MSITKLRCCARCGITEGLQRHHIIPKTKARRVGPDYWNLYSSTKFIGCDPPQGFQEAADRWASLPHQTQLLCQKCSKEVHREIRILFKRQWQAVRTECQCFECQFFRDFDLGNLFAWFVPDSPLVALESGRISCKIPSLT